METPPRGFAPPESFDPAQQMQTLQAGCRTLGIPLTPLQVAQFEVYYQELVEANAKFNLTAITGYEEVQVKHFLDSLVALPLIVEEVGDQVTFSEDPITCEMVTAVDTLSLSECHLICIDNLGTPEPN